MSNNLLQFVLAEVHSVIPEEILQIAFTPQTRYKLSRTSFMSTSIDQTILDKIIHERVKRYFDTSGSKEVTISLDGLQQTQVGIQAWTCHIPKSYTQGRSITHPISIHVGLYSTMFGANSIASSIGGIGVTTYNTNTAQCGLDSNIQMARTLMDNYSPVDLNYTTNVHLVDENTIYCEDRMPISNLVLRCLIDSDDAFSSIQGGNIRVFTEWCILAVKAYIYNKTRIQLDKAALEGGVEIGAIREVIDGYSDADTEFREMAQGRMQKIIRMSDRPRRKRYLNMLISKSG